jgi:hypothetical protein
MILLITDYPQHWFFSLCNTINDLGGNAIILSWQQLITSAWVFRYDLNKLNVVCNNKSFTSKFYCQALLSGKLDYSINIEDKHDQEYSLQAWLSLLEVLNRSSFNIVNQFDLQRKNTKWREIYTIIQDYNCPIIGYDYFYDLDNSFDMSQAWSEYAQKAEYKIFVRLFELNPNYLFQVYYLPDNIYYVNKDIDFELSFSIIQACRSALKSIGSAYGRALLYKKKQEIVFVAISSNFVFAADDNVLIKKINTSFANYLIKLKPSIQFELNNIINNQADYLAIDRSLRPDLLGNKVAI